MFKNEILNYVNYNFETILKMKYQGILNSLNKAFEKNYMGKYANF